MSENPNTYAERRLLDALYRALREHQVGTLQRTNEAVGSLDLDHSAIIQRVENLCREQGV